MRVLVIHNFYQQPGGEDQVYRDEVALLRDRGHAVETLEFDNDEIAAMGRLSLAIGTIWNRRSADRIAQACAGHRPQVVHFHNTFPLVSPAGYRAARRSGAAVVQTLHNYRLVCPAATLFRDGAVCEKCLHRAIPWPAVRHQCYRGSTSASAVSATMLAVHRLRGTYRNAVDRYIALTEFAKQKLIEGGLPPHKLTVKPNFVADTPPGPGAGNFILFVGRLAPEKGIAELLQAWRDKPADALAGLNLRIAGDGPLAQSVRDAAAADPTIQYQGRVSADAVAALLAQARLLVFPSRWYEGLPKTIIEAYAKGTPVLATRLGSMTELVEPGSTGALFDPADPADLIRQAARTLADPAALSALRSGARRLYESRFTPDANYRALLSVYEAAVAQRSANSASPAIVAHQKAAP